VSELPDLLGQVARLALPLVLATLSEVVAERAGVVNLALEGIMLAGALSAWLVAAGGGGGALAPALLVALVTGMALAALLALFVVRLRANAIVAGTAIHFLCLGATGLLFERFKGAASVTTFRQLGGAAAWAPYVGALLLVGATLFLLERTRFGLHLRAAGDSPAALRAAGGSPGASRVAALLIAGALAGLAGATLTTVLTGAFVDGMTAGRGFLALGLVLFARWNALGALAAGLFLGAAFTLELRASTLFAAASTKGALTFALRALPYLLVITALALAPRRTSAPAALGRSHDEE
jgi:simple sugar transport system permease protein